MIYGDGMVMTSDKASVPDSQAVIRVKGLVNQFGSIVVHDNLDQIIAFNTELWTSIGIDPDGEDETFDDQAPDDE